jgi:hypothetical protein
MNLSTCIHHLTRGENFNHYTTDESSYSRRERYPLHHRWIILLEARSLSIIPPMNLSTCIHHLTWGENVNHYTTDESSYSRRERYPLHHRWIILLEARTLSITPPMNHLTRCENVIHYTTDESSYSRRERYPLHHRWSCLHVYIILLDARTLTITPAINHLTRGEHEDESSLV